MNRATPSRSESASQRAQHWARPQPPRLHRTRIPVPAMDTAMHTTMKLTPPLSTCKTLILAALMAAQGSAHARNDLLPDYYDADNSSDLAWHMPNWVVKSETFTPSVHKG